MTQYKQKNLHDLFDWRINFSFSINNYEEFETAVTEYFADVKVCLADSFTIDDLKAQERIVKERGITFDNGECVAGKLRVISIAWKHIPEDVPFYEVMDNMAETAVFMPLIDFDSDWEIPLKEEVCDFLNIDRYLTYEASDLLIFDRLEILPCFAGMGLGLEVLRDAGNLLGRSAAVIALKAFPLQLENKLHRSEWTTQMNLDALTRDEKKATRALEAHYARLGFRKFPGTNLMVFNKMDYRLAIRPKPKKIVKGLSAVGAKR